MKTQLLFILCSFFILTNCSTNSTPATDPLEVQIKWSLINVSGGFSGVNKQFELETIIWHFNEETSSLTVINANEDESIEDGLNSGIYTFYVLNTNDKSFLIVDNNEFGNLVIDTESLTINQNITSEGDGADRYLYEFQRIIISSN
jgi:hypothetical protein